jgi:cytochrome c556
MKRLAVIAAVVLVGAAGIASAQEPSVIELRQTAMDLTLGDFAGINAAVAAKTDVKKLEAPATAIQRWARLIPAMFPKGSETGNNTKALPAIWSDNAGFVKDAAALQDAAGKLVTAAKAGDEAAVGPAIKAIGQACGACHHDYRAR